MKNKIILLIFIISLIGSVFLIFVVGKDIGGLTSNLINLRFGKSEKFIQDYTKFFNQTWGEMNQCVINCPKLPRIDYIVEDCIFRCEEKQNESLIKKLIEEYSSEEIAKYSEEERIKKLNEKIVPLYECVNNCGKIILKKDCVNSCLYSLDE